MVKTIKDERQIEFDILFDALPDVTLRDQRDALERPLVGLAKNINFERREFWFGDLFLVVDPHQSHGQPTIWDYDIIIYVLGQLNERFKHQRDGKPEPPSKMVKVAENTFAKKPAWAWEHPGIRISTKELLEGIGRSTSGQDYKELRAALSRLKSCQFKTNIWHGKMLKRTKEFSLLWEVDEDEPGEASSGGLLLVLPDWMIKSLATRKGILSIHPDYFRLRGGYERFLYRMARKYAGRQDKGAVMKMATLHEKSASPVVLKDFAKVIRKIVASGVVPEYDIAITKNAGGEELINMAWNKRLKVEVEDWEEDELGSDTTITDAEFEEVPGDRRVYDLLERGERSHDEVPPKESEESTSCEPSLARRGGK